MLSLLPSPASPPVAPSPLSFSPSRLPWVADRDNADGSITAVLDGGAEVHGDVLIGADGIWSNVRASMTDTPSRGDESGVSYSGDDRTLKGHRGRTPTRPQVPSRQCQPTAPCPGLRGLAP